MRASKIFFVSCAPLLVLACGGSADPGIGNGGDGGAAKGDASSSSSGSHGGSSGSGSGSSSGSGSGSGSGSSTGGSSTSTGGSGSSGVKRVFVTSVTYNGSLGGASGADAKCQTAADAQVLGGSWKAWISSGSTNAIDRIAEVGPWYLVDGYTKVFNNKANMLTTPESAITMTETGAPPSWMGLDGMWSGTDESGNASGADCEGWSSALTDVYGSTGSISADQNWGGSSAGPLECDVNEGLICFEQ